MIAENAVRRGQVYGFLAGAFLYPHENWTKTTAVLKQIVEALDFTSAALAIPPLALQALQAAHRRAFGAVGSLCYETEYGLPHEYRQSQEMADIAGFYRAFGFTTGGEVRERPDHVAVELEFMHVLALKEAYAAAQGLDAEKAICVDAQRKFLQDHLGRWFELFAQSLALNTGDAPYLALARFASAFIRADATRLGITLERPSLEEIKHTPFDPDFSCAGCSLAPEASGGLIRPGGVV